MQARLDGIGHVLRDRLLAVPPYQRSYTWTDEEVTLFIRDLQAAQGALEPTYFIGTIVVTPGADNRLTVIDGQQRLATTALLFDAISRAFRDAGDEHRASVIESQYVASRSLLTNELEARLLLNDEDQAFFSSLILNDVAPPAERQSHRRLTRANILLHEAVAAEIERSGSHWQDAMLRWVSFLDTQVQVILVIADNDADAFLLFETLNDRGVDLTVADLLKNHLFGLARASLGEVEQPWLAAVENLDTEEDKTFTTFVRHYWSSIQGATREKELYRSLKRYVRSAEQAVELATGLEQASVQYAALATPNHPYWRRVSPGARDAVGILLSLGLEQNRPLMLAAMASFDDDELGRLVEGLLSWSVRGLIVGGIGGGTTERYYADAAVSIRKGNIRTTEDVLEAIRPIVPGDEEFRGNFEAAGVYRTNTGLYLLLALERALQETPRPAFMSAADRSGVHVEAVLPRGASPDDWPGWQPSDVSALTRRLGNFVLLPEGSRLVGRSWDERRLAVQAADAYAVNRSAANAEAWVPDTVRGRQTELAARAPDVWPSLP
jgi:hypothetical protein